MRKPLMPKASASWLIENTSFHSDKYQILLDFIF